MFKTHSFEDKMGFNQFVRPVSGEFAEPCILIGFYFKIFVLLMGYIIFEVQTASVLPFLLNILVKQSFLQYTDTQLGLMLGQYVWVQYVSCWENMFRVLGSICFFVLFCGFSVCSCSAVPYGTCLEHNVSFYHGLLLLFITVKNIIDVIHFNKNFDRGFDKNTNAKFNKIDNFDNFETDYATLRVCICSFKQDLLQIRYVASKSKKLSKEIEKIVNKFIFSSKIMMLMIIALLVIITILIIFNSFLLGLHSRMLINYSKFFIHKNDNIIFNKNIDINLNKNLIKNFDMYFDKPEVFHMFCDKYLLKGYMTIVYLTSFLTKISLTNFYVNFFAVFYNTGYTHKIKICFPDSLLSQIDKPKTVYEPKIVFELSIYKIDLKFFPHKKFVLYTNFIYSCMSTLELLVYHNISFKLMISMKSNLCTKTINFLSHE